MTITQPDKWVRKAIYDAFNGTVVDGVAIPVFDQRAPNTSPSRYVIIGTQISEEQRNKQQYFWFHSVLLEVVTRTPTVGNAGSRVAAENIYQALRLACNNLTLDAGSNLTVLTQVYSYPSDLTETLETEIITRKFLRIELKLF